MAYRDNIVVLAPLLVTAGTSLAATVDALYDLLLPQVLGDPAHACGCEIVVSRLDASEAAKALVTRLFPLCNQITVCITLVQAELIQLL